MQREESSESSMTEQQGGPELGKVRLSPLGDGTEEPGEAP